MKKLIFIALMAIHATAHAAVLEEGRVYQLQSEIRDIAADHDPNSRFWARKDSKFKVHDATEENYYLVTFVTIYDSPGEASDLRGGDRGAGVVPGQLYRLPRSAAGGTLEKTVTVSREGFVSGTLIVPFKYRLDDKSLGGDATIGLYAGYSWEPRWFGSEQTLPITPFVAGGLAKIGVSDGNEVSSQDGFSVAIGVLFPNWDGAAIGLVVGQDRIGDGDWQHEGENWLSFMIGWEL